MKKINVAKLLKDCPQNMELDCTMFNKVTLFTVDDREGVVFPITVFREDGNPIVLTKYGQYTDADFAKCVIFPKGKTTWEGFQRPFKKGDIIYTKDKLGTEFVSIFQIEYERDICTYWDINISTNKLIGSLHDGNAFKIFIEKDKVKEQRLATEEEKQKLFQVIKDNGYEWNSEAKTLEKLVEPEFNVGDWIIRNNKYTGIPVKVIEFDGCYSCELNGEVVNLTQNDVHNNFHLWTINDAKDGDVLATSARAFIYNGNNGGGSCPGSYCGINTLGRFQIGVEHHWTGKKVYPATKEQRDLLFQKMREVGYRWVAETKTLDKLPKFKVGDKIKPIGSDRHYTIKNIEFDRYILNNNNFLKFNDEHFFELVLVEPKFKDGDVLYIHSASAWICIYNEGGEIANVYYKYVAMSSSTFTHDDAPLCCRDHVKEIRLATEEEKEKLFKAIKDNGYQWNTETKTLEKLPKFKVGDKIRNVIVNLGIHTVLNVDTSGYAVKKDDHYGNFRINFDGEKNWELVLDVKPFDKVEDRIKTLKPFDKVLMRSSNAREWMATFYSHYSNNKFYGCGMCCSQCIPYEGNEHLLGTTDDCNTFYKTSE